MTQWEYYVFYQGSEVNHADVANDLQSLGKHGWELVTSYTYDCNTKRVFILKRIKIKDQ